MSDHLNTSDPPKSPRAKRAGKTDTWMPLFIGDYLADTMHLNAEKHGAYLLLLMHLWRTGFLVDNADQLSSIARCDVKTWTKSVWPTLFSFFDLQDGKLYQKRLMAERENAAKLRDIRSTVGKKGAETRWQTDGKSMANASQIDGPSPLPLPHDSLSSKESQVAQSASPAPRTKKACRLPDNWSPSAADRQFAQDLGLDPDATAPRFADYWRSLGGSKAAKADWSGTWRNWCRTEHERRPAARASPAKVGFRNGFAELLRNENYPPTTCHAPRNHVSLEFLKDE
jgi:uncharacterized protein YdaU (DUF1376 family)